MGNKRVSKYRTASYVRNFVFGVEDSLVSTVGLLSGIASGGVEQKTILLTGVVLIFVEGFSMGVGSFLSEESAEEYLHRREAPLRHTLLDAIIMFSSYFIAGFIPLAPYFFLSGGESFWVSIGLSLAALFMLGLTSGRLFRISIIKSGVRMLMIGGLAIAVGMVVGKLVIRL